MDDKLIISAVGDILPGDLPLYQGIGVRSTIKKTGIFVFEYVKEIFSEADVVFGNLENVLSSCVEKPNYYNDTSRGSPDFVKQLKEAHFNIVNIANNHIQQHGKQALFDTVDQVTRNGIKAIGTPNLNPQVMHIKDIKLGFVGYSLRPEDYALEAIYSKVTEEKVLSDVTRIKGQVDHVIISLHWGDEYISFPTSRQISFAHNVIDNGASIVLGHHPHVLQGVERYKHGVIAYSLGNFISDMCAGKTKQTMVLKLILDKQHVNHEIIPCKINSDYQPVPQTDKEKQIALYHIETLLKFPSLTEQEYSDSIKEAINSLRKEYYRFLMRNWYKYPAKHLIVIFYDFFLRRF